WQFPAAPAQIGDTVVASRHGPSNWPDHRSLKGTRLATDLSVDIPNVTLAAEARPLVERLAAEEVASKLASGDPTLWGPEAESEASVRLSWTTLHESSRPLLAEIDALRAELHAEGLDRIVLAGMGGSSLAPEVIAATANVRLTVLD